MTEMINLIEFQMSLLLFIALAGYLLASRVHQSAVIGEILVGLVVGPSILGLITYTSFVSSIAHLGAVVLLFVVGLEFRIKDIARPKYFVIALLGVLVPWAAGYFTSMLFGFPFASAVFIGTALTATSIAITANVLKEMGKLQTEAARAIIGAAVIDDVLGLLALAIGKGLVSGSISPAYLGLVFVKAVLFLVVGALLGHFGFRRLVIMIDGTSFAKKYPEVTFIFAMMFAFLYGMAAELIGLSAIVGAFIAGASLGSLRLRNSKDLKAGSDFLQIIFASIFFVSLGILADVRALDLRILLFLVVLTVVAIISKLVACGGVALAWRSSVKESVIIGFGMAPRGEVAMIVALIGLNQGLIKQDIYVSIILMSLVTTIVTPIILRNWLYREGGKKGRVGRPAVARRPAR
ncbi:MAG: cation:proton antiporter [Acidobacteria bacterium]|nr:cation:proton antiporter [Acidobacteriota bacterium]